MKAAVYTNIPGADLRDHLPTLADMELFDTLWTMYHTSMAPLKKQAVQRHVYHYEEFRDLMNDRRIQKWVLFDDTGPVAFGAITRTLEAATLIEPEWFADHYPTEYMDDQIWYTIFMTTRADPDEGTRADWFRALIEAMSWQVEQAAGICALDYCAYNVVTVAMPQASSAWLTRLWGHAIRAKEIDAQTYYLYDFGATALPPAGRGAHAAWSASPATRS